VAHHDLMGVYYKCTRCKIYRLATRHDLSGVYYTM